MSSRAWLGITVIAVLGIFAVTAAFIVLSGSNAESNEYRIVINEGTGDLITAGEDPEIIPSEIELSLSGQNVLVIENHDVVDHSVGLFYVHAGETIRQEFTQEAVYQGQCTIHPDAQVTITVRK